MYEITEAQQNRINTWIVEYMKWWYIYIIRRTITITIDRHWNFYRMPKLISFSKYKYNNNFSSSKMKWSFQVRPTRYRRVVSTWVDPQKIHILITGAESCVNRWVAAFLRELPALNTIVVRENTAFLSQPPGYDSFFFFSFFFSAAETLIGDRPRLIF